MNSAAEYPHFLLVGLKSLLPDPGRLEERRLVLLAVALNVNPQFILNHNANDPRLCLA